MGTILRTPRVDWIVRREQTVAPQTPAAAKPRRSAAIPAPPEGSRPAMESAEGNTEREHTTAILRSPLGSDRRFFFRAFSVRSPRGVVTLVELRARSIS